MQFLLQQAIQARINAANKKRAEKDSLKQNLGAYHIYVDPHSIITFQCAVRERNMLKQKKNAPSADQERTEIRKQLVNIAKKRVKIVKDYMVCHQCFQTSALESV